jgi:L-threonylcarbamoyladenylate synthase
MKIINLKKIDKDNILDITNTIRTGGLIIFPTDTVYGVGADVFNKRSADRIYKLKKRSARKSLILFLYKKSDLRKFVKEIPKGANQLIDKFWPGPLTLIFKATKYAPGSVRSNDTVAIRIPDCKPLLRIMKKAGVLLATTSANISGNKSALSVKEMPLRLLMGVDTVFDGGTISKGKESTIVDLTQKPFKVLREGAIGKQVTKLIAKNVER